MKNKTVVIGIGNPFLQDDRAGVAVIEKLEEMGAPCNTETVLTVGFEVMDKAKGYDRAIIVDACMLGKEPGSILELSVDDIFSTHSLANSHAVTLGTTLKTATMCFPDEMPETMTLMLIEVKDIKEFTRQMSAPVEKAVDQVVARIMAIVDAPVSSETL